MTGARYLTVYICSRRVVNCVIVVADRPKALSVFVNPCVQNGILAVFRLLVLLWLLALL